MEKDMDFDEFDGKEYIKFLMDEHEIVCFESGDHPDEVTTPYSAGADALVFSMTRP